jgi:hypothetical protein
MEQSIRLERRFAIIDEWLLDLDISDRAVRLYAVLARYADSETHKAYPSRGTLAERLKCSKASVDRASQELVEAGAMKKKQRHNSSVVYTLQVSSPMTRGVVTGDEGGSAPVMRGVLTGDDLTITTELEPTKQELLNQAFDKFWAVYPKKDDKPLAKRSFEKALHRTTLEVIVAGAERYRDDPNREAGFTKNPSTWLNADAWANGSLPSTRKMSNSERNIQNLRAKVALLNEQPMKEVENGQAGNRNAIDFGVNFRSADSV